MKYILPTLTLAMISTLAQAQTTELPANVKADLNRLTADHAVIKSDFMTMRNDREQFFNDIKPIMKADKEAIKKAVEQLKSDKSSKKDEKTIQADEAAVAKAIEHKKADKEAIFGALPFHRHEMNREGGRRDFQGFQREGFAPRMDDCGKESCMAIQSQMRAQQPEENESR